MVSLWLSYQKLTLFSEIKNTSCKNVADVKRVAGVTCTVPWLRTLHSSGLKLIRLSLSCKCYLVTFELCTHLFIASIYIIFVIAALELRRDILNSTIAAIQGLATAFRQPPSGECFSFGIE